MYRVSSILLGLAVALSAIAMLASSASAAINFEWGVAGAALEPGESQEFEIHNDGKNFDIHGTVGGISALLLSTEVSASAGSRIIGGDPGTNEESRVFKGVSFDGALATCGVSQSGVAGQIQTTPLRSEIVEAISRGERTNEVLILFAPKTGETFATFESTGASCPDKGVVLPLTGSVLGLPLPQKTEVVRQALDFEAVTKEYRTTNNQIKTAGLVFAGSAATLSGLVLVILKSGLAYAPF
jgi:hypothetical protein